MWDFLSTFWDGFSNASGVGLIVIASLICIKDMRDRAAQTAQKEEDALTDRLSDDLEAELFGAPHGSDGRHA